MLDRGPAGRSRLLNVALLIAGYGVGQGSIFLAQSWLLASGRLELLALFGTHFAFALFGIVVVEAGSLTILARHAASLEHGEESVATMWRTFWEMSVVRAALALAVIAAGTIVAATAAAGPFTLAYALWAAPAFLVWAVNAAGLLDGLKLSGISGVTASLAHAVSAVTLAFCYDLPPAQAGALLGAAFSTGYLLTVAVQLGALHVVGWSPRFERPRWRGVRDAARDGTILLGTTLPGQFYFRGQLLMCSAWLGPGATALLIYVKQIVNAASQLIGFIRRVEFPALVQQLAGERDRALVIVLQAQRLGTWLALALTTVLLAAGLALAYLPGPLPHQTGWYLALFSMFVVTNSLTLGFTQGLAALGLYHQMFVRTVAVTITGLLVSYALARPLGIAGFALADVTTALLGLALLVYFFKRRARAGSTR